MSEPEKDPSDEEWLNRFMTGQDDVSRAYRQSAREVPPPQVDEAVLKLARDEDELRRRMGKDARGSTRWQRIFQPRRLQWPFALAATVVLAFSAIMAVREDHGARQAALLDQTSPVPKDAPVARERAPAVEDDSAGAISAAPADKPQSPSADPARSRSRSDFAPPPAPVAAAPVAAGAIEQDAERKEQAPAEAAPQAATLEPGDSPAAKKSAAVVASSAPPPIPASQRKAGAPGSYSAAQAWTPPDAAMNRSATADSLTCPADVPNCSAWRSAQRTLDAVFTRDETRRARCFTDKCPIGSTITSKELADVASLFSGESTPMRLRGRWQAELAAYAFSDRYVLQRNLQDDGSAQVLLRRVRYHVIGEGIEVLEDTDDGPAVVVRVNVESSRALRLLDAQGQPHGALEPGTVPLERWLGS